MAGMAMAQEGSGGLLPTGSWPTVAGRLWRLSWPIVLARIGIMTMGLTDAMVVGRFSARELGYQALGWAPTAIILTTGVGLMTGVQVMAARRIGEGRPDLTGAVLRRGLVYGGLVGLACTMLTGFGGPAFLRALGLDRDLVAGASRVLWVLSLSLAPYLMSIALSFWLEGLGRPGPGLWSMWAANGVNLALNLWLVPGGLGVAAMGAVGAACATVASRTAILVFLAVYVARDPSSRGLGVFGRPAPDPRASAEQRRVGYGAGASYFVEAGAFAGMNIVAAWISPLAVAAWSIVLNVTAMVFMVPLGLAGATAVLVGSAWGAGDRRGVVRAAVVGCGVSGGVGIAVSLAVWPTARWVAGAYATDPSLIALAGAALALAAGFFMPDAVQVVAAQALRARGDVVVPTVTHTASYAVLMLPLGWALAHPAHLGLTGVMWAVIVASWLAAGLLVARFVQLARRDGLAA